MKIRFAGPNVVEGLRELTTAGVLETPVPECVFYECSKARERLFSFAVEQFLLTPGRYLANVHSLARNSFVVQDMNRITVGDVANKEAETRVEDSE